MELPVVLDYYEAMGTYSRIGLLRSNGNLQSYWTTAKLWKLTVVLDYYEAMETYSRIEYTLADLSWPSVSSYSITAVKNRVFYVRFQLANFPEVHALDAPNPRVMYSEGWKRNLQSYCNREMLQKLTVVLD